jgi:PH (Pleckstrin Homology) domain-containing protein
VTGLRACSQVTVADSVTVNPTVPPIVTARAQKTQRVAYISAVAIVLVFGAVALTLRGKTDSGQSYFHAEDQIAMTFLGFLAAVAILWFTRPRLIANADGVRVRNLLGWIEIPWAIVSAVRFDRGSPWVAIDLKDDDVISVMAIQAADKEYAVTAVRGLRALLAASQSEDAATLG